MSGAHDLMTAAPFIDTLSAAYDFDIHSAHRAARERSWYARTPMGLIFLDYEAVHWLLHEKRFRLQGNDALDLAGIRDGRLREWFEQILSNKEGEPHARLRRIVARAFTPRQVERLRPMMRATAREFIASLEGQQACEFVESFAAPYPVRVIGGLLGVPPADFARFHAWSRDLSLAFGSRIGTERPRIEAALANLDDYADGLVERCRRYPGDDLTSALVALESSGGDFLDAGELRAMLTVLIFGGQDTTQCQLAFALATFARHPGVEPTNNHAERALRPFVLWRKTSYGSQSERGRLFAERIMTVAHTLRLQKRSIFRFLVDACQARSAGCSGPSLLPTR